jgi:hypothetical protein
MRKLVQAVALAVAFTALAASSAGATTGPAMIKSASPFGTASNTAAISGNGSNFAGPLFGASGATIGCSDVVIRVTTVSTTTITGHGAVTGCIFSISGTPVATATVTAFCTTDFSFTGAIFNNTTGATTSGTLSAANCGATVVTTAGCTIHGVGQTLGNGISAQNISSTGANDTSATPWGAKLIANVTGITYTSTGSCPGIAEHGSNGSASGTIVGRNIWGAL